MTDGQTALLDDFCLLIAVPKKIIIYHSRWHAGFVVVGVVVVVDVFRPQRTTTASDCARAHSEFT